MRCGRPRCLGLVPGLQKRWPRRPEGNHDFMRSPAVKELLFSLGLGKKLFGNFCEIGTCMLHFALNFSIPSLCVALQGRNFPFKPVIALSTDAAPPSPQISSVPRCPSDSSPFAHIYFWFVSHNTPMFCFAAPAGARPHSLHLHISLHC